MKKLLIIFLTILSTSSFAQKFGTDSVECLKNLSLYTEYYKHKNYSEAIKSWREVNNICPQALKNIYIDGAKMYRYFIKQEQDSAKKQLLVDTLLQVYKNRINYFGQKDFVNGRIGTDIMKYRKPEFEKAYHLLDSAITGAKEKSEAANLVAFINASSKMLRTKKIEKAQLLENYFKVKAIAEVRVAQNNKSSKYYQKALVRINKVGSKYLDCEELIKISEQQLNQDSSKLASIVATLKKSKCTKSDFYVKAIFQLAEQNPANIELNYQAAGYALEAKNYSAANKHYAIAIELYNADSIINLKQKANILYGLAQAHKGKGNYSEARKNAEEALKANPDNGLPYILIGDMYTLSNSCGNNEFENKAVYWLAVDMYKKAKASDPSITALVANKIASNSKRFPDKETAFFHGYQNGQTFTIKCWINKTTTVKLK